MKRYLLLILISLQAGLGLMAQDRKLTREEKGWLNRAEYLFDEKNYTAALPLYLRLDSALGNNAYMKYRAGIAYMHKADEKEKAVAFLEEAYRSAPELPDILYHLGRAYQLNYRHDEAIQHLEQYLQTDPDEEMIYETNMVLNWARQGKEVAGKQIDARVANIGSPVNTLWNEYVPVISADQSVLIYTYRGERSKGGRMDNRMNPDPDGFYFEDIFITYQFRNEWTIPESISDSINTTGHDAAIALSNDGQKLFIFKSTPKDGGDIYISHLKGSEWSAPVKLEGDVNSKYWEGSCSLSNDEQTLYFSSERPGGFGGRDIYRSNKLSSGAWGPAENLGPVINTPYDDDAPFIHPDGTSLFFSSKGHSSMGGFDIFNSREMNGTWSKPENLGYPVNTAGDDIYYVLTADGTKGFYSSSRNDSKGGQDIYEITPGVTGTKPVLALVIGNITANGAPVEAEINVTKAETGEEVATFHSNATTGKYLLALTPGNKYKIAFEVEGYDTHIEYVDVESLDAYIKVAKDFHFKFEDGQSLVIADSKLDLQTQIQQEIERYKRESNDQYLEQVAYNNLLKDRGDEERENVTFFIDLGKFEPESEAIEKGQDVSLISQQLSYDGRVRATAGPFKTLLEAEIYRQRFIQVDSAFANSSVKVNDNGQVRTTRDYFNDEYQQVSDQPLAGVLAGESPAESPELKPDILNEPGTTNIPDFEKREVQGLSFKVEIAAVNDTSDFKLQRFSRYGAIESKTYDDGITRYTMGPFKTLEEAENFRKKLEVAEPEASESFVTVFYFGQRKTVEEYNNMPCREELILKYSKDFIGKDLNDKFVYDDMLNKLGDFSCRDFVFTVQIGAFRNPSNVDFKWLNRYGKAESVTYPDGITRFTIKKFATMKEAEEFRQEMISRGISDAWITGEYKGERKLLEELFRNNFYVEEGL